MRKSTTPPIARALAIIAVSTAAFAACDDTCERSGARCGRCSEDNGTSCTIDAPPVPIDLPCSLLSSSCNIQTQNGCNAGEKCTWLPDGCGPQQGLVSCVPAGARAIGETCTRGAPGLTSYDDCVGGAACHEGTCKQICDHEGGTPWCSDGFACVPAPGTLGPVGELPHAGVCEPSCDPIADNDFDGSGSASIRTGTTCGPDPSVGCYGHLRDSGPRTHFLCVPPASGTGTYVHRSIIPANQQYLNSCHPGYTIAFGADATGSTNVACYAFCVPGNSYLGAPTQEPNGKPGHQCRVDSGGRSGNFGTPASATDNGEHCMYSWLFELDDAGAIYRSPTSDTVGICYDHTKYTIDHDANPATPQIQIPRCAELPLDPVTGLGAEDLGCVESALAGHAINRAPIALPHM